MIAAFLLAINPLYSLHAHRAMSEASCEAFMLVALAWVSGLESRCFRRTIGPNLLLFIAAGCSAGLSIAVQVQRHPGAACPGRLGLPGPGLARSLRSGQARLLCRSSCVRS